MDLVLKVADEHVLTPYVYPSTWPEDDLLRQGLSLSAITILGGYFLYLSLACLSYIFIYDKNLMKHPQYLPSQVYLEIEYTCKSVPLMGLFTVPLFMLEVNGYSKLYDNVDSTLGWVFVIISMCAFLFFTDMMIYFIHRGLHHRLVYKHLHKPHHKWKVPTPFASHAFHPVDGFLQSCPYHIYPFLFPLHKVTYLGLFVFVNIWTISIHDGDYRVPTLLRPFINGSAHHTDHHTFFDCNYGQFFTLWDHIGRSFRSPTGYEGKAPRDEVYRNMNGKNSYGEMNGKVD